MLQHAKDNMLRLYVQAANRLSASAMSRDQRGQAFSDYLMVIAFLAVVITFASAPAKDGIELAIEALFDAVSDVLGSVASEVFS